MAEKSNINPDRLLISGWSARQIGRRIGRSASTVERWLAEGGPADFERWAVEIAEAIGGVQDPELPPNFLKQKRRRPASYTKRSRKL